MIFSLALIIPGMVAMLGIYLWRWNSQQTVAYCVGGGLLGLLICGIVYPIATYSQTSFCEVWNYKVQKVQYYQAWDEKVSCRHPKYRTVTRHRTVTDSKGRSHTETYTEEVFDGYRHSYDVDDHPEDWVAIDDYGVSHNIDRNGFENWCRLWKSRQFVDMHRTYHSVDGDMYEGRWPGEFQTIYPWAEVHTYENRVRVARSAFSSREVDAATRKAWPRFADNRDFAIIHCYGAIQAEAGAEDNLQKLNATLGPTYRVHLLVMLFDSSKYNQDVVQTIKDAWKGPNKNELVVCVGIAPQTRELVWADVMSWMDDTTIHSLIRQDLFESKIYSDSKLFSILQTEIPKHWKKKDFRDFNYLQVDFPTWAWWVIGILCIAGWIGLWFPVQATDTPLSVLNGAFH